MDQIVPAQPPVRVDDVADDRQTLIHRKYVLVLVLAVLIAFGPMLLVNQWLWDDWVIVGHARYGDLWEFFKEMGRRDQYLLMQPFATYGTARDCLAATLLISAAIGPLTYALIRRAVAWPPADAFWAALLTALVPMNQARFFLSTMPYIFSSGCFLLALVLLLRDIERPALGQRVISLVLMFMAFSTNSFLVLAWIAPALVLLHGWRATDSATRVGDRVRAAIWTVLARWELLLAPPIYWGAKKFLLPSYGLYANYNKFQMDVFTAVWRTITTLFGQFTENAKVMLPAPSELLELAAATVLIGALFAAIAYFWRIPLRATGEQADDPSLRHRWIAVVIAWALAVSALFPYVLVGQPPRYSGLWETRHQTTLMLFSGFFIVAGYRLLLPRRLLARAAAITAVLFLTLDISFTHRFVADVLETGEIAGYLKRQPPSPGTMMFVLENDRTYRTFGRFFPFYELAWLARGGEAAEPKLAQSNQEIIDPSIGNYAQTLTPKAVAKLVGLCKDLQNTPQFGSAGFVANGQVETINLTANRPRPGPFATIYLAIRRLGLSEPDTSVAPLVHIDSKVDSIGGACRSPCCDG